jgi:transposase
MGYTGHLEKKIRAQKLRREGLSYSEIQKYIDVPKSTLSGWCRDIALTEKQALRLYKNKLTGSAKGRIIGAKHQQAKRLKQISEMFEEGKIEVGKLTARERFIAGISLYAAEGTKRDKACCFSNSDPLLIRFMTGWFREFCKVPEDKLRGAVWIHDNLDYKKAQEYWSDLAKIPLSQFHKTYIVKNKEFSNKIRKNIHDYGVFSVRFSSAKIHRKLMGWISGIVYP